MYPFFLIEKDYLEALTREMKALSKRDKFLSAGIYVRLTTLERECREKEVNPLDFLARVEGKRDYDESSFPSFSSIISFFNDERKKRRIAIIEIARRIPMDRCSYYRYFRRYQTSCTLITIYFLSRSLSMTPYTFIKSVVDY